MPYTLRKVRNRRCYSVKNRQTKKVFAKCTSKAKAKKQLQFLRAIKYSRAFREKLRLSRKNNKSPENE